jgi:hypothetical protein
MSKRKALGLILRTTKQQQQKTKYVLQGTEKLTKRIQLEPLTPIPGFK